LLRRKARLPAFSIFEESVLYAEFKGANTAEVDSVGASFSS